MFEYNPKTKGQSVEWHTPTPPRPKKIRMSKSEVKFLFIMFFDIRGITRHKFVPHGTTVNDKFYVDVFKRRKRWIHDFRLEIADVWKFIMTTHQLNCLSCDSLLARFKGSNGSPAALQCLHVSLRPFLFPRCKTSMK